MPIQSIRQIKNLFVQQSTEPKVILPQILRNLQFGFRLVPSKPTKNKFDHVLMSKECLERSKSQLNFHLGTRKVSRSNLQIKGNFPRFIKQTWKEIKGFACRLAMILVRFILDVRVRRFHERNEWKMKGHFMKHAPNDFAPCVFILNLLPTAGTHSQWKSVHPPRPDSSKVLSRISFVSSAVRPLLYFAESFACENGGHIKLSP